MVLILNLNLCLIRYSHIIIYYIIDYYNTVGIVYYHNIISQDQRKVDLKLLKFFINIFLSTELYTFFSYKFKNNGDY